MIELIAKRQENSKTFKVDSRKNQLRVSMGAIHYKDNYTDRSEQWKDIDLTWENNKITKAPYELTREGKKFTIRDKKDGEVSTIELLETRGAATFEVIVENSAVRFRHTLLSGNIPFEAKFKVTGNFTTHAFDDEDELPLEVTLKDGILTERMLSLPRTIKGTIMIDPTWQVSESVNDATRGYTGTSAPYWNVTYAKWRAGWLSLAYVDFGSAARFLNFTVPAGATILTAYLILTCRDETNDGTVVRTRIRAERNINSATFSTDTNFDARTWTNEFINWDGIGVWTNDVEYDSPDFAAVIQEVIDLPGWASGNPTTILWDDFETRSDTTTNVNRDAYSWDSSTIKCEKLIVTYTTGWSGGDVLGVDIGTIAKINGIALADIAKVNGVA